MKYDIVVLGHLLKEDIVYFDSREAGPVLGGPASYSAVAAGSLGFKVGLVTKIGADMPEELLKVFKETGVDTKGVGVGKDTTTNRLIYDRAGNKRLEYLNRAEDILCEDIPEEYLESRFFLVAAVNYEVPEVMLKKLYEKGKKLSMELSGFGGASSFIIGKPKEEIIRILSRITRYFEIVKGGKEDYERIFGRGLDIEESARMFLKWGTKVSIVTMGSAGSFITTEDVSIRVDSIPAQVVDITGAGDVWHAGFLCSYLETGENNEHLKENAVFASAVASLAIEKTGGVIKERFPDYEKVKQRIISSNIIST